jgi:hypothetical protein
MYYTSRTQYIKVDSSLLEIVDLGKFHGYQGSQKECHLRKKLKTLKSDLEPYFKGLKGGKRTKKRHLHRYNKNKSNKRRH